MEQYYKKVEIKSENDLPKETNYYATHNLGSKLDYTKNNYFVINNDFSKQAWINSFDWYLLPLQEPITQPMPSDELLRKAFEAGRDYQMGLYSEYHGGHESEKPTFKEFLQSLPVVPSEITEQKILEKIQECVYYSDGDWSVKNSLRELAKEIYSLLKQSLPKQEETSNINWAWIRDNIRKLINKYKPTPYGELGLTNEIVEYLESIFRQSLPREDKKKEELRKFVKYADKSPHLLLNDVLKDYLSQK
jgi:hypothetical protein